MDETQLAQHAKTHENLGRLIHQTLLSLLRLYDVDKKFFHSRLDLAATQFAAESGEWGPANPGDTATLLLAIEHAQQAMQHGPESSDLADIRAAISESLKGLHGKNQVAPISYKFYQKMVFQPCLNRIAAAKATSPSKSRTKPGDRLTFKQILDATPQKKSWETFNACRILALLHKYPDEKTHEDLYVKVLEVVLRAVTHPYPPHYLFGGASLSGTESHAFISHECLTTLSDLVLVLEQRAKEHKKLAELISDIHSWCSNSESAFFRIHERSLEGFLEDQLDQLKNPVGLSRIVRALRDSAAAFQSSASDESARRKSAGRAARRMLEAIGKKTMSPRSVRQWLTRFEGRVSKEIKELDRIAKKDQQELEAKVSSANSADAGATSILSAPIYASLAGIRWTRAFFEGMQHVLSETEGIYARLVADKKSTSDNGLKLISQAVADAGEKWELSARRTRDYLAKLSRWTEAEIHRQIALHALERKTNFDPAQLAFALGAYHCTAPSPDSSLVDKALQIVFDSQLPDGTWPSGAPFSFDRDSVAANNNSNLEIMNALLPLITRKGASKYRQHADRVFSWLETNKRELTPPGSGSTKKNEYPIVGWSTDRILETGRIDSWMTAAALHFLVFYRKLLQENVNEHLAKNYDRKRPKMEWHKVIDAQLRRPYKDRVTTKIYEQFIRPFKHTGASLRSAMVLHGPPGTAKTTLAEAIATELEWDMFTITPSDFVKNGIENSEASARTLFKEISQLREAVVFFDEIDEMLRDRQDEKSQSTVAMLRFLIPGMLPKLQSLKQYGEKNKLIFIVATNYIDRLDAAITRTGRIDEKFAIVPPDLQARYCLLQKLLDSKKTLFRSHAEMRESETITENLNLQNDLKQKLKDLIKENKGAGKKRSKLLKQIKDIDKQITALKKEKRASEEGTAKAVVKRINGFAHYLSQKTAGWVYKELDLLVETLVVTKVHGDDVAKTDQRKLFDALSTESFETVDEILEVKQREDRKNLNHPLTLNPHKICDREPALDLFRFYNRRGDRAKEEFLEVLRSYGISPDMASKSTRKKNPSAERTPTEVEAAIEAILAKEEQSQEEIMTAFASAISKTRRGNQSSAPNSA